VRQQARQDKRVRLVMSAPGVGPIVGLTYVAAIDDPARFKSSKQVGPHFGLTPKKYQSGETDYSGRISKIGDVSVRTALYEAANVILTKPLKGATSLKSWGMKLAKRAGRAKAKVALARKLGVIMHRMWVDGTKFADRSGCAKPAAA
jgi:transposase